MEKLVVIDTGAQDLEIHIYDFPEDNEPDDMEEYLKSLGHQDSLFYFGTSVKVINHGNKDNRK